MIAGHADRLVFARYNILAREDLVQAADRIDEPLVPAEEEPEIEEDTVSQGNTFMTQQLVDKLAGPEKKLLNC